MFKVNAGTFGGLIEPLENRAFEAPLLPSSEPDGGAGGGTPEDAADPVEGAEPAAAGEPDARAAAGDDDDESDDDEDPDLRDDGRPVDPERFKRVTAKLNKLNRRARRFQPVASRLKELKESGLSLDDLLVKARNHDALEQTIRSNPRLARAIYGGDEPEEQPASPKGKATAPQDAEFDESTLPFDPNESPINRYFADLAKQNHELNRTVRQLAGRVDQADGRDQGRVEREERGQWKAAIDGAAVHIKDDDLRDVFRDAVSAAYKERATHRWSPQQMVTHYLKKFKVDPAQAAKANTAAAAVAGKKTGTVPAAGAQRIAERNQSLSRNVAPQGTPAPARTGRETLADVHKRLRSGVGA